jgi:hypothetical protein
MPPFPLSFEASGPDAALDRLRTRIGIVGAVLMLGYMAILPLLTG